MVAQPKAGRDVEYNEVRDKVMSVADNGTETSQPVLVDIGQVGHEAYAGDCFVEETGAYVLRIYGV